MGGERRKKEGGTGKGEREGRKGTEEGPTKNSCRGAQNVKLRHCYIYIFIRQMTATNKKLYRTLSSVRTRE